LGYTKEQENELKKYLIENKCKVVNDDDIGGLVLDCKLTNENRIKSNNINNTNNTNNIKKEISTVSINSKSDKKRKGFNSNIHNDDDDDDAISNVKNKKQKKHNKESKHDKEKKRKVVPSAGVASNGMTERSKPRIK
jgi:hypothetical protein